MNLAACGAARQREDFVMRLGCFLVTFAVLASLVLEPPRAKAFAMTSSAVTALAGGFLSACGLTPVVSGMGSSEEVNESVARLIQEYLTAELPGGVADAVEWLGQVSLTVNKTGKIIIPALVAQKLGLFARWVAGKYGAKPGVNQIYYNSGASVTDRLGNSYDVGFLQNVRYGFDGYLESSQIVSLGAPVFQLGDVEKLFYFDQKLRLFVDGDGSNLRLERESNGISNICLKDWRSSAYCKVCFFLLDGDIFLGVYNTGQNAWYLAYGVFARDVIFADESLSLDVSDTMQEVLDRLTALEEGQSIALDVGATQSMEIQEILQGILDAILAGDLTASAEIVDTAEVPVEPEEPDPPVVPVVPEGLDKLGAALTSRFPFSIPWDVYKGVTLLAAPPKAPYFEVDFMAPIADRVGGWKGSTKIVLDFSEYEIIGQVCRWTSTIGFCLMLATGTKRLIWTA